MRTRMSEKEKLYFFALIFPVFWPLAFGMAMCDMFEYFRNLVNRLYKKWMIYGTD